MEGGLLDSERLHRLLFDSANDAVFIHPMDPDGRPGRFVAVNDVACARLGYSREELLSMSPLDIDAASAGPGREKALEALAAEGRATFAMEHRARDGRRIPVEISTRVFEQDGRRLALSIARDVTERSRVERRNLLALGVLDLLNRSGGRSETIREILLRLKAHMEVEAVGIRMREGDDFPYYEVDGFSEEFVRSERSLCSTEADGRPAREADGSARLECMCGCVIRGQTDPSLPYFTAGGSFWTNRSSALVESMPEAQRPPHLRGLCAREGYESFALVPLRSDREVIGLLQLNDRRRDVFTREAVEFLEGVGASIGVALARRRAEEALEQSRGKLREAQALALRNANVFSQEIISAAAEGIVVYDLELRYVVWNRFMEEMTGIDAGDVLGRRDDELFPHLREQGIDRLLARALSGEVVSTPDMPYKIQRTGRSGWAANAYGPRRDATGAIVGVIGVIRDITARKLAEQALERDRAYLQAVLSSMADAVLTVSDQGEILSWNERALELLGRRSEDLVGQSLDSVLATGDGGSGGAFDRLRSALHSGEVRDYDTHLRHRDGGAVPVSLSCAVLRREDGRSDMVVVARDISVRRRLQDEQKEYAQRMEDEVQRAHDYAEAVLKSTGARSKLVGRSRAIKGVVDFIKSASEAAAPVLVLGESGTGKEVVARSIHLNGPRADRPFVVVDCSALHGALLESEIFGHEKGAFTGAAEAKPGLVEVADGGTLFVDEIGEMPLELQSTLLRVLESGEFRRVGSVRERRADIRVVAATNRDLAAEVKRRRFRSDLYFRLNVLCITVPPLKERRDDIALLARHFLENCRVTIPCNKKLHRDALRHLEAYDWPGNVRELSNVIERAIILSGGSGTIRPSHLPVEVLLAGTSASIHNLPNRPVKSLEEVEREAIEAAMAASGGNKSRASELLGISRLTLHRKLSSQGKTQQKHDDA